ncbi:MAG: hypothetical protein ACRDL8_06155, partial [Solirubrobacteraceae bacterium]
MRRSLAALGTAAIALSASAVLATPAAATAVRAHGSVEQVYATGIAPRRRVRLIDRRGSTVAVRRADSLGGVVFRNVAPGSGYRVTAGRVRAGRSRRAPQSARVTVLPDRAVPRSTRIYDQRLPAGGYGYLRTRDGTLLAIDVRLPGPAADGPYPT